MKKCLLPICFLLLIGIANGQKQNLLDPWHTWGIGHLHAQSHFNEFDEYNIEGWHLYMDWNEIELQKDNFDFTRMDIELGMIVNKDIWIGLQIQVGPNCPEWMYEDVPRVFTTGGLNDGPYPYYLDPDYKKRYFLLLRKVAEHIDNLPENIKSHLMYWQIAEGSTGDGGPYKGTPTNPQYEIDYYTWQAFKHEAWDSADANRRSYQDYRFLFNTGNFAEELQYVRARFPHDNFKCGYLSHFYSFDGELLYFQRQYHFLLDHPFTARTRGEVQDNFSTYWWKFAPVKQAFTLACSAIAGGLDMLNIGGGYIDATLDTRPTDFFSKYAGIRHAKGAKIGFIALRDVPDFSDTTRFPEAEYGQLITPGRERAYSNRIKTIQDNPYDSSMYKYWQEMKALVANLNPARISRIVEEFEPLGAMYTITDDDYHNDFGTNMTWNFGKFIYQVNRDSTSIGGWRIGPDTSMYGRYARLFKIDARNKGQMYFKFNDSLVDPGETVKLTVTYYDTSNGVWSVIGSNKRVVIKNRNTNSWVQKTISVNNFVGGTLLNGEADFSLRYESGSNTPFALLEVNIVPANKQPQPDSKAIVENINLKLSPNPNKGQFSVELTSKTNEAYSVFVTNANGNLIFSEKKTATAGVNIWNFSSPKLKEGVYVVHVESAKAKGSASFVVNK